MFLYQPACQRNNHPSPKSGLTTKSPPFVPAAGIGREAGNLHAIASFLARGDVALSVAITSVTTLLAPVVTPALIYLLASQWLQVSASAMFWSILQVVVLPIALGVVAGNQARIATSGLLIFAVVVLHNGLGVALATAHFSPLAAVPSAIFSVWHNISGPLVVTLYQRFRNEDAAPASPTPVPVKS